jgi:5-methylcytosine-specific restriction endonuclease McrA
MAESRGRCAEHAKLATQTYDRNSRPHKALYNSKRWKDLRLRVLAHNPICVKCNRNVATTADHIRDHEGDVTLFHDFSNLQALCGPCHSIKTGHTRPGGIERPKQPALDPNGRIIDYGAK